ncbi:MAG: NosD domain-containing protein [Thermoplasmata archaeon]
MNVSYNTVENLPGFGSFSYGIDVEYFYTGNNYISHNTVLNGGSASHGIYLYEMLGLLAFDNRVNNTSYAYYIYDSPGASLFNNTASNSYYGLYSYYNENYSYYSNTFINDNYSLVSFYDYLGYIYANTLMDTQSNAPTTLYFLYLYEPYGTLMFYHNNFLNETKNSMVKNYYYNPSNYPVYMNAPLPTGGNYWSNYTGSGYNGIGTTPMPVYGSLMDYYPLTSRWISPTVTFMETGLPPGTAWSVSLGSTMYSSSAGSIVFSPTNGQYMNVSYSISHVSGYVASTASGTVYLNGMNKIVTVSFTPYTYAVTFTESNLPSGTTWSVTLNGNKVNSSTSTISFSLSNGTYNYSIGTVTGYNTVNDTGTFQINGASKSISINFVQDMYTLVVSETGLPAGMAWTVNVSGTSRTTTSTSVDIQLVSGTYNVSVSTSSDYNITLSSRSVTINNANATVSVVFKNTTIPSKATNSGAIYEGLGAGVVVGAVVGILGTMMYSGTWIFRKFRKGKGGTQ